MKILLLPGDGTGPEITTATKKALTARDTKFGLGRALETRGDGEDALASLPVRNPGDDDVLASTDMFGDALSNEAAELSGGIRRRSVNNVPVEAAAATEQRTVDDQLADTATHTPDPGESPGTGAYGDALAARMGAN